MPKAKAPKLDKKGRETQRQQKLDKNASKPDNISASSAQLLSLKTIKEGMTIMGCVKEINQTDIQIALPGRINATVDITSISGAYVKAASKLVGGKQKSESLDEDDDDDEVAEVSKNGEENDDEMIDASDELKTLKEMFSIGQIVCTKVQTINPLNTKMTRFNVSMRPDDINADIKHTDVVKGSILWVAVAERGDHGFVLETGIKNLRGFLPKKSTDLIIGNVYFCRVKSVESSSTASTAIFELAPTSQSRKLKETEDVNVELLLPGTLTSFTVTKILKDGLQGTIFGGKLTAIINEHQLGFTNKCRNKFKQPKDFAKEEKLVARILCIFPLTKFVYLSLNTENSLAVQRSGEVIERSDEMNNYILPVGKLIQTARVSHIGAGGVILNMGQAKGVIAMSSLKKKLKGNFDEDELLVKYALNSVHTVRVKYYDPIDMLHICTSDPIELNAKYFVASDVNVGDFVNAKITRKLKDGRYEVLVGCVKGFIDPIHLSPTTPSDHLKIGKNLECRVIAKTKCRSHVFLTNRPEFMDKKASVLLDAKIVKLHSAYVGLVKSKCKNGWLVEFFNHIRGIYILSDTGTEDQIRERGIYSFSVFKLKHLKKGGIKLNLKLGEIDYVRVGELANGKVMRVLDNGIEVALIDKNTTGFVPLMYLSDFPSLVHAMHRTIRDNDDVKVIGISKDFYSLRDTYTAKGEFKAWTQIKSGNIIPAVIKDVQSDTIKVQCLIKSRFDRTEIIHYKMFLESMKNVEVNLVPEQKILVRVLDCNKHEKSVSLVAKLQSVWSGDLHETDEIFRRYFSDIECIKKSLIKDKHPIVKYNVGDVVEALYVKDDNPSANERRKFVIDGKVNALVNTPTIPSSKPMKMLIIWIDYANCVVYGSFRKDFLQRCEQKQNEDAAPSLLLEHRGLKADIALILDDLMILYPRKVTNRFIYVPTRLHYNDFQPIITKGLREGALINVNTISTENGIFVGIPMNLHRVYDIICPEKAGTAKRKIEETAVDDVPVKKVKAEESDNETTQEPINGKASKKKDVSLKKGKKSSAKKLKVPQVDGVADLSSDEESDDEFQAGKSFKQLPGVSNFWSTDLKVLANNQSTGVSSSEEDSSDENESTNKRKKMSAQEKFQAVRLEEERIRAIEKSLADDSVLPTTVDQFDRWLMAEPNNSRAWIHYMAFHVQASELDRARSVARKALKTINFRESQELLNIWTALLNLELRFGTTEAFNDVLKEALQVNEPFKIYSICLQIFADCKRVSELCDTVLTMTKKFRQQPECWLKSAHAYFQVNLPDKAKPLLTRALQSLPEREREFFFDFSTFFVFGFDSSDFISFADINLIVRFANLCNKFSEQDHAHALMEQILVSYPKRIDCWSQYVDMLIKNNDIDIAR